MAEEEEDLPVEREEIEQIEPPSQQEDGEKEEPRPTTSPLPETGSSDQTNSPTNDSLTLHSELESVELSTTISPSTPLPLGATNGSAEKKRQNLLLNNNKSPAKTKFSFFKRKSSGAASSGALPPTSTTGLILEGRPKGLPAKTPAEEKKHQKLYQEMIQATKKKELQHASDTHKMEQKRHTKEDQIAVAQKKWAEILPKFDSLRNRKEVKELWWAGLPPGVRGLVWKKAIGNDLNISPDLYMIFWKRFQERLDLAQQRGRSDSVASVTSISRESSVDVIHLDLQRTFPTLGFFQEGSPLCQVLHNVLGAYACYRPDVGYVQGMSFLAAVIILNMENEADAFIALANLLNRASYLAFFKVDQDQMKPYFTVFSLLLAESLPKVSAHFNQLGFHPQFYLIEWIFTIYTRNLPLDVACRVWDLFCRDGDFFLYRTALGILNMYQHQLLQFTSIEDVGHFLGHLPSTLDSDQLFSSISSIPLTEKKFSQLLTQNKTK
ncbi:PREDICTED: TBC1 domain family member 12-like [Amphimedon queenslandica]|uniref:Rab-GAP TBC domain-containing protein n=1 Tax=Amphimedon queenslandica TaxID=400682 RepID=A0A1X7VLJ8_AMPQE|nr:PREDICTED: TBC1 domain family member 12-like [Amphimedon queenslandica]|eukprot:XP_003383946.3 PREDICTED: TBC1 domain family member 12-like [Amphimedon queenslandica]